VHFFPIAIKIILVLGGFYLAYEGVEKIVEYLFHRPKEGHEVIAEIKEDGNDAEKAKIKSAVTTDFILSVEIVIIALGTVLEKSLTIQILTVSVVALLATIGVYGIVAIIVRMDDAGHKLIKTSNDKGVLAILGRLLVKSLPVIIRILSVVGTIALILVSGGIFVHNIDFLHHLFPELPSVIKESLIGLVAGLIIVALTIGTKKIISLFKR
jgi:predicted DNA repair protein MutK